MMATRRRRRSESEDDRTLFAKGLCYHTTEETLIDTFNAVSARIPLNNQGRSKGFAYIEFECEEDVDDALENHQGIEVDGWTLILDYVGRKRKNYEESGDGGRSRGGRGGGGGGRYEGGRDNYRYEGGRDSARYDGGRDGGRDSGRRSRGGGFGFRSGRGRGGGGGGDDGGYDSRPRGGRDNYQNRTVYIKGISEAATEDDLMDILHCSSIRIPKDRETDENKGFAYADFEDHTSAQSAIDALSGQDGLFLEFARERGGGRGRVDYQNKTLYLKGIPDDSTEDSLIDLLGCSTVRIPRDRETDEPKGFAYADFEDHSSAQSAIETFNGHDGLFLEFARERGGGGRGRGRGRYRGRRGGGGDYNGY